MGHFKNGIGVRQLNHFGQLINNQEFTKFDYGKQENLKKYGTPNPMRIPLENIKGIPIAIFAGK